jgi:hypothetical protein
MDSNTFFDSDAAVTASLHPSLVAIAETRESDFLWRQVTEAEQPASPDYSYGLNIWLNGFLIIPILGWFLLIASVLNTFFKSHKSAQTAVLQRSRIGKADLYRQQHIPCAKCRYFSSSSYLHCAVRPSDVLTTGAIDCSDYVVMHEPE